MKKMIRLLFVLIGPPASENGKGNILKKMCFTFSLSQIQSLSCSLQWVLGMWRSSQAEHMGGQRAHTGCSFCSTGPGSAARVHSRGGCL